MSTHIAKATAFLLILILLFVVVSYVMRPHTGDFLAIQTYGTLPKDTLDVIYFGGSSCLTYWAPMESWKEYGFTSYDYANHTMPAQVEKYCIIEALKTQSPQLLIVDVRPFEYAEDPKTDEKVSITNMYYEPYLRNFTDTIRYSTTRYEMIQNTVPEEGRLYYHFDIAKYHENLPNLVLRNSWKYAFGLPDDESKAYGGYRLISKHEPITRDDLRNVTAETVFSQTLNAIFLDLVDYCKNLDMDVLFIVPPYAEPINQKRKHNYMSRIAEENGIPFINVNDIFDEVGLDTRTDFYNINHTNLFGGKAYTKWLGQYLKDTYNLPDHRNDSAYQDWDVAYDAWVIARNKTEESILNIMPEDIREIMIARQGDE